MRRVLGKPGRVFQLKLSDALRAKLIMLAMQSGMGQAQVMRELLESAEYTQRGGFVLSSRE